MLFAHFRAVPGKEQGRRAALVARVGLETLGRSAAGCGGRGCLPAVSHAGALQDALSAAAEVMPAGKGKKGRAGGNGDNCLMQAEMKGSGPHGEVTAELCV